MSTDIWLSDSEQCAWRHFITVQRLLAARLTRRLQRESGLSGSDYEILVQLSESPEGRMRAFEIGQATQWEKSRLSHHLTRMAQRGLIERQTCAKDNRYADIVLTKAGRTAIEQAAVDHATQVRRLFVEALTPQQLGALTEICQAVLTRLDQEADETQDVTVEQECDKLCE